ncbi:hypothetical protein B0H13DRAFT_2363887 [Mycena leptocephala]|nr:hypothetical protein B0H13DRAFT_2363887 [Mycena leptocephala]
MRSYGLAAPSRKGGRCGREELGRPAKRIKLTINEHYAGCASPLNEMRAKQSRVRRQLRVQQSGSSQTSSKGLWQASRSGLESTYRYIEQSIGAQIGLGFPSWYQRPPNLQRKTFPPSFPNPSSDRLSFLPQVPSRPTPTSLFKWRHPQALRHRRPLLPALTPFPLDYPVIKRQTQKRAFFKKSEKPTSCLT